ncbi:MAG: type II toxin-antitoxin system RelE family toxin [Burkholderiaceae bacterium]
MQTSKSNLKKLIEHLQTPRLPFAKLSGHNDRYKIKLRSIGYLLVYEVSDKTITILVEAVGKRDKSAVYLSASQRLI